MSDIDATQAAQDISYIKEVLARTATTMIGFGRVFIVWGIFLLVYSLSSLMLSHWIMLHYGLATRAPAIMYVFFLKPIALALALWWVVRKLPAGGMARQLIVAWVWTLILALPVMDLIQIAVVKSIGTLPYTTAFHFYTVFNIAWGIALLSQALFFTGVLTKLAVPKWLAILCLSYGIVAMVKFTMLPASLLLAITLLALGGYFEWERRRQEHHGTA